MGLSKKTRLVAVAMNGALLSSLTTPEKKKPQVIIVGEVSENTPSHILEYIEKLKEKNEIIIVASIEEAKEKNKTPTVCVDITKLKSIKQEDLEPIMITNHRMDDFLPETLLTTKDLRGNNPWPSPKGNKNKSFPKGKHTKRIWNRKSGY